MPYSGGVWGSRFIRSNMPLVDPYGKLLLLRASYDRIALVYLYVRVLLPVNFSFFVTRLVNSFPFAQCKNTILFSRLSLS